MKMPYVVFGEDLGLPTVSVSGMAIGRMKSDTGEMSHAVYGSSESLKVSGGGYLWEGVGDGYYGGLSGEFETGSEIEMSFIKKGVGIMEMEYEGEACGEVWVEGKIVNGVEKNVVAMAHVCFPVEGEVDMIEPATWSGTSTIEAKEAYGLKMYGAFFG
jgi:hypothetical protein